MRMLMRVEVSCEHALSMLRWITTTCDGRVIEAEVTIPGYPCRGS